MSLALYLHYNEANVYWVNFMCQAFCTCILQLIFTTTLDFGVIYYTHLTEWGNWLTPILQKEGADTKEITCLRSQCRKFKPYWSDSRACALVLFALLVHLKSEAYLGEKKLGSLLLRHSSGVSPWRGRIRSWPSWKMREPGREDFIIW